MVKKAIFSWILQINENFVGSKTILIFFYPNFWCNRDKIEILIRIFYFFLNKSIDIVMEFLLE